MALASGAMLGPYQIVGELGAGGMGEVYKARDIRLGRTVAIKVLPDDLASDPSALERREREARAISRLSHPSICALHDIGQEGGVHFLVLEYLEGESLARRLARGPLRLAEALRIAEDVAGALGWAHQHGIVHRDVKPGNIMLTPHGIKLLDFGLARLSLPAAELPDQSTVAPEPITREGSLLGTFPYMAPEQFEGRPADARSDVFALGIVLYEMVSGRRPFSGTTRAALVAAVLASEPPPLRDFEPGAPVELDRILRACLAKQPDARWQSAREPQAGAGMAAGDRRGRGERTAGGPFTSPDSVARGRRHGAGRDARRAGRDPRS